MGSASKHNHLSSSSSSSSSKLLIKNPSTSSDTEDKTPNPNPNLNGSSSSSALVAMDSDAVAAAAPMSIDGVEEDSVLSGAEFMTREEVIRRRSRRVKQLQRFYKDHYWALMEELRVQYRDYYWKYGKSPFKEEEEEEKIDNNNKSNKNNINGGGGFNGGGAVVEASCESNNNCNGNVNGSVNGNGNGVGNSIVNSGNSGRLGLGFGENGKNKRCAFPGCKTKAMALTNYCHPHILSDSKQKLYKACTYVIKSAQSRSIHCGKPILSSTVPSLCTVHFQKAQKHVTRALKKAGLNISSTSKLAPKFHVIVAESVRQINAKRREKRENAEHHMVNGDKNESNVVVKEEASG